MPALRVLARPMECERQNGTNKGDDDEEGDDSLPLTGRIYLPSLHNLALRSTLPSSIIIRSLHRGT